MLHRHSVPVVLLALLIAPGFQFVTAPGFQLAAQAPPFAERPSEGVSVRVATTDRTTRLPLPGVRVTLRLTSEVMERVWEGSTGSEGYLLTPRLLQGTYTLELETLGFADFAEAMTFDEPGSMEISVGMVPEAVALEPLLVAVRRESRLEREGFYLRQEQGMGYFITRADIEVRNPNRPSDLFMSIPGARVSVERLGTSTARITLRGGCVPTVVLNGAPITIPIDLDELVTVQNLEAIEIYHGAAGPVQFAQFSSCGTIVVWLREQGGAEYARPMTLYRVLGVAALAGFFVLFAR